MQKKPKIAAVILFDNEQEKILITNGINEGRGDSIIEITFIKSDRKSKMNSFKTIKEFLRVLFS
jgi:hypothetical protein